MESCICILRWFHRKKSHFKKYSKLHFKLDNWVVSIIVQLSEQEEYVNKSSKVVLYIMIEEINYISGDHAITGTMEVQLCSFSLSTPYLI